jgi:hypothetical protein
MRAAHRRKVSELSNERNGEDCSVLLVLCLHMGSRGRPDCFESVLAVRAGSGSQREDFAAVERIRGKDRAVAGLR